MMYNIMPKTIDEKMKKFCKSISNIEPLYVDVHPVSGAMEDFCYENVYRQVKLYGGELLPGWRIQLCPNLWVEAVHHAIWISDSSERVDITPQGSNRILFLPDIVTQPRGYKIGEKYAVLTDDSLVVKFIKLCNKESAKYISRTRACDDVNVPLKLRQELEQYQRRIESEYIFNKSEGRYCRRVQ